MPMILYLRRRTTFSAGFSQPSSDRSGIGHDYVVDLTVGGPIDPVTGMVVNIKDVDAVLKTCVVQPLHGRLLDRDVAAFQDRPATPEGLAEFVWQACGASLPKPSEVAGVTVWQGPTLRAEIAARELVPNTWKGSPLLRTFTRTYDFSASHRLHAEGLTDAENTEIFGKCNWSRGHGHNYDVEITLAGDPNPVTGQIASPEILDTIVEQEVLTPFDHRHLNYDVPEFAIRNPTSENLTVVIWERLARRQSEWGAARLHRVMVRETARNYFEYFGE